MIEMSIPIDHASFPGHFPGNPILPGVLLLERVMTYAQSQLPDAMQNYSLLNVKFLAAVSPGDRLVLKLEQSTTESTERSFSIYISPRDNGDAVLSCSGKLRFKAAQ